MLARDGGSLTQGAMLVDEAESGEATLLVEHTITDARVRG